MRVLFPEADDQRVIDAARQLACRGAIDVRLMAHARHVQQVRDQLESSLGPSVDRILADTKPALYNEALSRLVNREADVLVVGATLAFSDFLPRVFDAFSTNRRQRRSFLFSAAVVNWHAASLHFLVADPAVVVNPSAEELVWMAKGLAPLVGPLFRTEPRVGILSHVSTLDRGDRSTKQGQALDLLSEESSHFVHRTPVQLDAALSLDVAERKQGALDAPLNILLLPEITSANTLYKAIELFGWNAAKVEAPFLWGLPHGVIGLLPRGCTSEQIVRSVNSFVTLARLAEDAR